MRIIQNLIEVQFENSLRQAQELEVIANKLMKISAGELRDAVQEISQYWRGDNASAYLQKTLQIQETVSDTARSLAHTGFAVSQIARNLYNAEKKALSIASGRSYGS